MSYYIYKFLNKQSEEIYVGMTNDVKKRINLQHFGGTGHLSIDCYKETYIVIYSECVSKDDAKIKERYLINLLKPKYNKVMNNESEFNFIIDDFAWKYISFDYERFKNALEIKKLKEDERNEELYNTILPITYKTFKSGMKYKYVSNKNTKSITTKYKVSKSNSRIFSEIDCFIINNQRYFSLTQIKNIIEFGGQVTCSYTRLLINNNKLNIDDVLILNDMECSQRIRRSKDSYEKELKLATLNGIIAFLKYKIYRKYNNCKDVKVEYIELLQWFENTYNQNNISKEENKLDCDFTCRDTNCNLDSCKDCELFQKCDTCTNQLTCEVN